ncbi:TolC family protein [Desulfurispira natronophila]|uniref:Outer membrane protein TolC n=1 Tax=Desulfurispira natronophila TaxID=682562 RepID=A0A7W7Y3G1_9BACT|nr:TolC family protein [Desulfurispira natronophila]MBB5021401.1 outer membrane protein TolC [Desulfurispira natronophila]
MIIRAIAIVFTIYLLCVLPTHAADVPQEVSFLIAYHLALENNKSLLLEEVSQRKSELSEIQARSHRLPRADASWQYQRNDDDDTSRTLSAQIRQPLYTGGLASAEQRKSENLQRSASYQLSQVRQNILRDLIEVVADIHMAQQIVAVHKENVRRLEEHVNKSHVRLEVGEISRPVLLQSQMALSEGRADYFESRSRLATLNVRLNNIVGDTRDVQVTDNLEAPPIPKHNLDQWLKLANRKRQDLRAEQQLLDYTHHDLRAQVSRYYPTLDAFARYNQESSSSRSTTEAVLMGVRLQVPIFEGGTRIASYREAKYNTIERSHRILQKKEGIRFEVHQVLNELEVLDYKLEEAASRIEYAQENLRMVTLQFEVGKSTNLDVLDAMVSLKNAEQAMTTAHYEIIKARFRLLYHAGILDTSYFAS